MKYIVYLFILLITIPLCFGYHLQFKFKYFIYILILLIISCWTTQTLNLIILTKKNLWSSYHHLNLLKISQEYFKTWWHNNSINNYLGFFASPISFKDFSIETFFPGYATGGIISNVLIGIFNYGFFVTNLFANLISMCCLICLIIFNKPFIFFSKIKQIIISIKNKKQKKKRKEKLKHLQYQKEKSLIDKHLKKSSTVTNSFNQQATIKPTSSITKQQTSPNDSITVNNTSADVSSTTYFNENSYLTPFGKINPEKQKDGVSNSKGTLVIKKSLEYSILNRETVNHQSETNKIE